MTRVLSALVLLSAILAVLFLAPPWATILLGASIAALGAWELAGLATASRGAASPVFAGCAAAVICAAVAFDDSHAPALRSALPVVLSTLVLAAGSLSLAAAAPGPDVLTRASMAFMAPVYLGVPLGFAAAVGAADGPWALLWLVLVIAISDSAQYYTGRTFGRRKLAPAVSPAKTIEGALGGLVVATAAGALLATTRVTPAAGLPLVLAAVLALVLAIAGMAGDLFESLLKRSAGVKDSSALIPGHGGVLDRVDAYLFAAPVYFIFLRYLA